MTDGYESLGKASLDLTAETGNFERHIREARGTAGRMEHALDAIVRVSAITDEALGRVKMGAGQAAESRASASSILHGVRGISEEALAAAHELDRVRLRERQASESALAGDRIEGKLEGINRKAKEARRSLESVKILGGVPGRSGVGVGPFGSGFGRLGALGTAVGAGVLTAPAAGPGLAGLLASIPTLAFTGAGALGTLALAFKGVGAAIKGDKKAFDDLGPAAKKFVLTVRSLDGFFDRIRNVAASGLFPGLTAGLRAALSPGTVTVLTRSIALMSRALGSAFAQWGRYLGSAQFQRLLGPLMQAGASNVRLLSSAMLHLFDALSVVGRAAIPFTTWMLRGVDAGARFASAWLRAQAATGRLARGMDEAKSSVRLVGGLLRALLGTVGALGRALYPVARVAVRELTVGVNKLTGIINRNRGAIREIVGGALAAFVAIVRRAAPIVGALFRGLQRVVGVLGGWKHAFEIAFGVYAIAKLARLTGATKLFNLALRGTVALMKTIAKWEAVDDALGLRTGTLGGGGAGKVGLLARLKKLLSGGGKVALLTRLKTLLPLGLGAAAAGLLVAPVVSLGGMRQITLSQRQGIAMLERAGWTHLGHGVMRSPHGHYIYVAPDGKQRKISEEEAMRLAHPPSAHPRPDDRAGPHGPGNAPPTRPPRSHRRPKPGDPKDPVFGKQPPFDKNLGPKPPKPLVVPASVSRLEALASQERSRAATARTRAEARAHSEAEIADLEKADQLLHTSYERSRGRARTRLFSEITRVENAIRQARAAMRKRLDTARSHDKNSLEDRLKVAVDTARLAVENAKVGSAAYERAVKAEEKALRAEIGYYDRRARNMSLSAQARDKALRAEVAAKKQLTRLAKSVKQPGVDAGPAIAQFLESFARIQSQFAPNAFPAGGSGYSGPGRVVETHLFELKHEQRLTNRYLRDLVAKHAFPATGYAISSAGAVAG